MDGRRVQPVPNEINRLFQPRSGLTLRARHGIDHTRDGVVDPAGADGPVQAVFDVLAGFAQQAAEERDLGRLGSQKSLKLVVILGPAVRGDGLYALTQETDRDP
jgi:hypothetical protein